MSLLHEAGKNIRAQRARQEEYIKQWEEDGMPPELNPQAIREKEKIDGLSAELVIQTEGILEDHGVDPEADRHKGILGKIRAIADLPGKEFSTTLTDDEGWPIQVRIVASGMIPKQSDIIILVQGINANLRIPGDRKEPLMLGNSDHSLATAEDIIKYKEVVDGVREKVGNPAPFVKLPQGHKL